MRDERGSPLDGHSFIFWSRRGQDRDGTVCGKCGREFMGYGPSGFRPFEAVLHQAEKAYINHRICGTCANTHAPDAQMIYTCSDHDNAYDTQQALKAANAAGTA